MSRKKPDFMPEPRIWNAEQVGARLGKSASWFQQKHESLSADHGMPRRDPDLMGWDSLAVERWLDARSGIAGPSVENQEAEAFSAIRAQMRERTARPRPEGTTRRKKAPKP